MLEPSTAFPAALSCRGLVKRYGDVVAVDGLDLEVRPGECFGLLGPNGAGKTTTIEILEGLNRPDAGEVSVLGEAWGRGRDRALRQRLGIQLQETKLNDKLSVEETVTLFRSFYARGPAPLEVIRQVSLEEKRGAWVVKLSGGQRQRLSVACALVNQPEVLFLDEPTTGLDPQSRRQLWELIAGFRRGGGTVLLTTHYMDEAEKLCDRVAIVDHGKVIALGTPAELIALLGADHVVEFAVEGEPDTARLAALPGAGQVRREAAGWLLSLRTPHVTIPALLAELERQRLPLLSLTTHHATLEDVFMSLTGRTLRDGA
ncbi:MAG: ABC transporter ATP-binding protein [Candidatus Eisenbacteria bacterium]|nr:ABC transporter ATP-binding protein [Candidatus Eisenbacteria bacterium]